MLSKHNQNEAVLKRCKVSDTDCRMSILKQQVNSSSNFALYLFVIFFFFFFFEF